MPLSVSFKHFGDERGEEIGAVVMFDSDKMEADPVLAANTEEGSGGAMVTFDPTSEVAEDEGYWYLIHSPPWEDEYFAPANTFLNGAHGTEKIATDYMVPDC